MIRFLGIRDLAIIDALECEFEPGFNVLTGETGAGKSIIVGAIALLVGERGSGGAVRTGAGRAVVQAAFETEAGDETIVRREVAATGRGRIFVDDTLVSAATLRELGRRLLDIHGQHAHQALLDPHAHLGLLDSYGGDGSCVDRVADRYEAWRTARARLVETERGVRERAEQADALAFGMAEIDRVSPEAGEDERLRAERTRLANAERIEALAAGAYGLLYERDESIVSTLAMVWRQVEELAALEPAFMPYLEERASVDAALEELARALRSCAADVEASPARLDEVESRLAEIERLVKKHGGSLAAVLDRRQEIADALQETTDDAARLASYAAAVNQARNAYLAAATALSARRAEWAASLAPALARELRALGIPTGRFEVRLESGLNEPRWGARGTDSAELFFSANPGEALKPLSKVASGGELSRVMLALKTLATVDDRGKTLVFDEVDAGIGGDAAYRVGERLRWLGERFQVLCVTHSPQLAAHATTHFHVSKEVVGGRTRTTIERLSDAGRVGELTRLMTGRRRGAAQAGAAELLAQAGAKGEH